MADLYILHSNALDKFYIGSCAQFNIRIQQHLNKEHKNSYTAKADDWEVFFLVSGLEYKTTRNIEKHIKKMKSKVYLYNLKKYPDIINKLLSTYSTN